MDHTDLYLLRETFNRKRILLCFNGPFSQPLIEEIGHALKRHLHDDQQDTAPSLALDVFAVYIELTQNIKKYAAARHYTEQDGAGTIIIGRYADGRHLISAGNVVEQEDGEWLAERIDRLAQMDRSQLKAAYKTQLRQAHSDAALATGAGLGLIDIARKAAEPVSCALQPLAGDNRLFFSLRVVIA